MFLTAAFVLPFARQVHAEETLLIKWKDGPQSAAAAEGNGQIGSKVVRNLIALGWQQVSLPPGMTLGSGLQAYRQNQDVLSVEPDSPVTLGPSPKTIRPSETGPLRGLASVGTTPRPNDPRYGEQWYLPKIGAGTAWRTTTGGTNVVVAVIDTGVDYTHPDLAANMWRNPGETGTDANGKDKATNGIDDDDNGYIDDVHGVDVQTGRGDPMDTGVYAEYPNEVVYHGTACAGAIAAVGNNGTGIAGVNWTARIMAIRFNAGDNVTISASARLSAAAAAYDYVIQMKRRGVNVRVTSNSYSGDNYSEIQRDAMAIAGKEGILALCSAGNLSSDMNAVARFPASYNLPTVMAIAASNESDELSGVSNFGNSSVALAAPGPNFLTTTKPSTYYFTGGTSFAAPLVAGSAALLLSVRPDLTVDELKAALLGSVDPATALRGKVISNGRLNIGRAIQYLTNTNPAAIVIGASPSGARAVSNAPIQITFNRPMNRASVEESLQIQPQVTSAFTWSNDDRTVTLAHDSPLDTTKTYTVRVLGTAQDQSGGTLDGDFDRLMEGSPADDRVWTFRFPIANDDFENRQLLAGSSGSIQSSNLLASPQVLEPLHVDGGVSEPIGSVWYRWTPPGAGGWYTFDLTQGTTFNSWIDIFTGDQLGQLVPVIGNDDYRGSEGSRASFFAAAGNNYAISVSRRGFEQDRRGPDQEAHFTLAWYPTPPPGFASDPFLPKAASPGARILLTGTNFTGATGVLIHGVGVEFERAAPEFIDLKLTAIVPPGVSSGTITVLTPHGTVTSSEPFTVLLPDLDPPSLMRVNALAATTAGQASIVTVFFDENLEQASAETLSNYAVNDGAIPIATATLRSDFRSVTLTTGALTTGIDYRLTLRNVADRAPSRNAIATLTRSFQATSLVLHLSFDDPNAPGADLTGNSRDASSIGGATPTTGKDQTHALSFDGVTDYLRVEYTPALGITGDITLAAWVKRESFNEYRVIVAKTQGLNFWDYDLYFVAGANVLAFWSDQQRPQEVTSSGTVADKNWNHVAVTRRGGSVTFYINGVSAGTATVTGKMADNGYPLLIGTDDLLRGLTMFKGQIDDVRIYNQALTGTEVRNLSIPSLWMGREGGDTVLRWRGVGSALILEVAENLVGGPWSAVTGGRSTEAGETKVLITPSSESRFYRLKRN